MNIDQDEVSQVVAIIEDCARIQSLIKSDREAAINEIKILSMLPHPSGLGSMPIGREASDRIFKLALRARHAHGLERRVSLQNVRKPLESELVKRFFKERRPVNHQQVNRLLSSAARAAERNCQDRTYYIPIRFASTQEPNCLSLGPVNLMTRKTAWSKLSTAGRAYARKYTDQSNRGISRMLIRDSLEYYRNFNWIAEVQIKGCDQETAEAAAFKAVGSAIDCLHIILSYRYSQKLRIGGLGLRSDRRALVQLDQNGEMEISSSHGWFEQAGLAEGWSKIFEERQYRK
ncbi:MAG: hypothetical protein H6844_14800 [Alphaproteobacteria bacterium]|nr:hypothetical protein [Alphaproteobacteria bacterium]